jgi:SulP family sulfate permease
MRSFAHHPNVRGDLWGGFSAMLVALPSAIAFGVTIFSPLGSAFGAQGAMAGMMGAAALGLVAAIFGGTPRLISAPSAPAAAVLTALTLQMVQMGNDATSVILSLFLVSLLSSLIQLSFGVLRLGELIKYMPYPVVSGYLIGVNVIIVLGQLPKWLAIPTEMNVWQWLSGPELWQWPSLLIGLATVMGMLLAPRLSKRIPGVIQGLVAGTVVYWAMALSAWPALLNLHDNPLIIGPLSVNLATFMDGVTQPWDQLMASGLPPWQQIVLPAITLAVLLSIDTLNKCLALDAITGSRHDSNQELRGQGLGNLVSSLLGGITGSGSSGGSFISKASGGTTHWAGIFCGLGSLLVILLLTSLFAWIPVPALAAMLVVNGVRMIDWASVKMIRSPQTRLDFGVIILVVIVANTVSLIAASAVGIGLAIFLFLTEQIHTTTIRRKNWGNKVFSSRVRSLQEREILSQKGHQTLIFELQGSLFFGTTHQLYSAIEPEIKKAKFVVLDFMRVQSMDMTASQMIERIRGNLADHQARLVIARVPDRLPNGKDLRTYIDHMGLFSDNTTKVFIELDEALEWIEEETLRQEGYVHPKGQGLDVAKFELFHGMGKSELEGLERCKEVRVYQAGDLVLDPNTLGHELMLISRGEVKVSLKTSTGSAIHLATLSRGQFFGEMSFLDGRAPSAYVYASGETEIFAIDRQAFAKVAAGDPVMSVSVMRSLALVLADRLRHTNMELREVREN